MSFEREEQAAGRPTPRPARGWSLSETERLWVRAWPAALAAARHLTGPGEAESRARAATATAVAAALCGDAAEATLPRRAAAAARDLHTGGVPDSAPDHDSAVIAGAADADLSPSTEVRAAFDLLPQRWRLALWALLVEGRSPRQTAAVAQVKVATVPDLHQRALTALRLNRLATLRSTALSPGCAATHAELTSAAEDVTRPELSQVSWEHLPGCPECSLALHELAFAGTAWLSDLVGATERGQLASPTRRDPAHKGSGAIHFLRRPTVSDLSGAIAATGAAAATAAALGVGYVLVAQPATSTTSRAAVQEAPSASPLVGAPVDLPSPPVRRSTTEIRAAQALPAGSRSVNERSVSTPTDTSTDVRRVSPSTSGATPHEQAGAAPKAQPRTSKPAPLAPAPTPSLPLPSTTTAAPASVSTSPTPTPTPTPTPSPTSSPTSGGQCGLIDILLGSC